MSDPAAAIAALEEALASGELTVEVEGKKTTYRSAADLKAALSYFRGQASAPGYGATLAVFGD